MTTNDGRNAEERFAEEWKNWLEKPPGLKPHEAAAAISGLIRQPRQRYFPRAVLVTACAAAAAMVLGLSVLWKLQNAPVLSPAAGIQSVSPLGENEMLIWLDDDTPLYMTFQPTASGR